MKQHCVLQTALEHRVALGAWSPGLGESEERLVLGEDLRNVLTEDVVQTVCDSHPLRRVFHDRHLLEKAVELRIVVATRVLARRRGVFAVIKEKEVFGIRVVRSPTAPRSDLETSLIQFFHHPGKGVFVDFHLDPEFFELTLLKLRPGPLVRAIRGGLDRDFELFAGRVPTVGIAGFGHELLGPFEIEAVRIFEVALVARNPRREELLGGDGDVVEEDADEGFFIERGGECLAELFVFSEDRVLEVEVHVVSAGFDVSVKRDSALTVLWREFARGRHEAREGVFTDAHAVEIALPEQEENGDDFTKDGHLDLIHEGEWEVGQRSEFGFASWLPAFGRESGCVVFRVADETDAFSANPFPDFEGTRADGMEAKQVARYAIVCFTVVVLHCLACDWSGEVHGEPVEDLRVSTIEVQDELVVAHRFDSGERSGVIKRSCFFCGIGCGLESGDVVREICECGGFNCGIGNALKRVAHVGGSDGAIGRLVPEAGVGMEPDAFFENASVGDFSIGSRLTGWEGF